MEGLTAKVFRTYNASSTLESELSKGKIDKMDMEEKKNFYGSLPLLNLNFWEKNRRGKQAGGHFVQPPENNQQKL
jgi:hypothetical protein